MIALIASRPELFENDAYHIDTTHLASVVRFSKLIRDRETLELAYELTEYGSRLAAAYQFAGDPPFEDNFDSHAKFIGAQLGIEVDHTLERFGERARQTDAYSEGTMPAETYIDLLFRLGRYRAAIDVSLELLAGRKTLGIAPSLLELCQAAGDLQPLLDYCRDQGDLLGFGTGLLVQSEA